MGIRLKLVLCLLAVLLPLVAMSVLAIHLTSSQLIERTKYSLKSTQHLEAARIEHLLTGYANNVQKLAAGPHVREFTSMLHKTRNLNDTFETVIAKSDTYFDGFAEVDPLSAWPLQQMVLALQRKAATMGSTITEVRLVDVNGNTLGETDGFSWEPSDADLIARSIRSAQTQFGDAFVNPKNSSRLGMASPIIDQVGEVVGSLVVESALQPITKLIAEYEEMGRSIEAHLAQATPEGDAQFITPLRFDRTAAFRKKVPGTWDRPIIRALNSSESRVVRSTDYRGVDSYLAYQTISTTGWGLVVKVDVSESHAPIDELRNLLMWATAASVLFVAFIYLFILGPVANRLKGAAHAANQIMDGNLAIRLVDDNRDEIADLADSINLLAHDLEIDQRKRSDIEARLRHQALHDDLTGLFNRAYVNKVINQLNQDNQRNHSVAFLDLNGFKEVNDRYGHAIGDDVLVCVAQRLISTIPQGCTLARWGGDEFVIVMPGVNSMDATEYALNLHTLFKHPIKSSEGVHEVSCSVGLATSDATTTLAEALSEADALMYEQKKYKKYDYGDSDAINIAKLTLIKKHKRRRAQRSLNLRCRRPYQDQKNQQPRAILSSVDYS